MTGPYQREHLKSLTGLRFVAALSVFVAHSLARWPIFVQGKLPFGAAGVSFFFVLSGFILTYVYGLRQKEAEQSGTEAAFSFWKFYLRRFARIWPIHFATLLIALFVVMGAEYFFGQSNSVGVLIASLTLTQSWIPNYDWAYALNGPSWSLAVEAFFYLTFPFLLLGGAKKFVWKYLLIIVATLAAVFVVRGSGLSSVEWVAYNAIFHTFPAMRLFEFATGVACGFWFLGSSRLSNSQESERRTFGNMAELLVVGLLVSFFLVANWVGMYDGRLNVPLEFQYWFRFCGATPAFAIVVVVFASSVGWVSKLLSSRTMVYLGEISYSFYMIHMPIMILMKRMNWLDTMEANVSITLGCLGIAIFLAVLLYHLVEVPFRKSIVQIGEGGNWSSLVNEVWKSLSSWIRTPAFVATLVLAGIGLWLCSMNLFDFRDQNLANSIVETTDVELKGINFEDDATLLGVSVVRSKDGSADLKLVWQLHEGRRSKRLIKLLDANEKVLSQASQNRALFESVVGEETVVDWVKIGAEQMKGVQTIAVSFYEKERKLAKVDRGPRSLGGRQLNVWVDSE